MIEKFKKIKEIAEKFDIELESLKSTKDLEEVKKLHSKFFGYLTKSKNAKEKWKDD